MQAPPTVSWPPVFARKSPCVKGHGMAVDATRGVVVVSGRYFSEKHKLFVYSLADGSLVRTVGGKGTSAGQFDWDYGGLCMTPRGTLLAAERWNDRLQEVNIDDGGHVGFIGVGLLDKPDYVDCSPTTIAVLERYYVEADCVRLLSWPAGALLALCRPGDTACGKLRDPAGLRLLADGSGVVVADAGNSRLCMFNTAGAFVSVLPVPGGGRDVVEVDSGAAFVVVNTDSGTLTKVSAATGSGVAFGSKAGWFGEAAEGQFDQPVALALVRCDGGGGGDDVPAGLELVVLDKDNGRIQVFRC